MRPSVVGAADSGAAPAAVRSRRKRQAALRLPKPFPGASDALEGGCSQDHAVRALPADWSDVAAVFARVAEALRDDEPTFWHEKLAAGRARRAERAGLLSRLDRPARRLGLELLRSDGLLDVANTEAIAGAVLAEPHDRHRPCTD